MRGPEDADREGWRSFFESLPDDVALRGVAHLAGVGEDEAGLTAEELERAVASVGRSGLALVQGMTDAGVRPSAGVWLVTRGGQVVEGERRGALSGASLWGFGATVGLEHGELGLRLLDLDPEEEPPVEVLADELLHPDRETRVAHRGGERRVARLARLSGLSEAPEGERIRGDRSYLVTGGLGGIGLSVAGWLADRGAGAIVLNGRRAPDESAVAAVEALRGRGVEVRVELADVTDGAAVDGLLSRMDRELLPLGGVIHSVGVLSDGAVGNLDWGRFEEVLWPKVLGAWRLHRATVDRELDLFVLFSSAAGVLGNAGQANYAAANAFLDQLARHRRALGLPGQAIAWGAWSEIGMAAAGGSRVGERLEEGTAGWLRPEQGLAALSRLVGADVGTSVVVAADWSASGSRSSLLEEVAASGSGEPAAVSGGLGERLRGIPVSEREGVLLGFLQEELASVLRLRSVPAVDAGFFELGMDSLMAVELRNRLNRALGEALTVSNTAVFDYPDAARLARHLAGALEEAGATERGLAPALAVRQREGERVAIVGMGCRFPGGNDPAEFWGSLVAGRDAVTRGRPDGLFVDEETEGARAYGAYVEGLDRFDAEFFRIAPAEAELLDPQQRLLLEVSWAALEDAGLDPGGLRGSRTGVYVGIMGNDYRELVAPLARDPALGFYAGSGVTYSTAVGRVAFALGLEGPAIAVDTACSSSLVAVHQAATALRQGEADVALAGGVNAILLSGLMEVMEEAGMLAGDGRCKTFDAAADGYVRGEGCGMVVLKRLSEAEASGDRILGVLLGSAVNQDGASAGLTVPNGPAQMRVIGEALSRAEVEASSVDYLEAHGTGTELGDPVEVEAAAAVYGSGRDAERPLLLGSVKTNIGHLEGAAGVAALIKAVLALRHGLIPPHLHFERPNPRIGWEGLPVRVTSEPTAWPAAERPRRAGVSSFGYSGTNAHVVIEGYRERRRSERRQSSRWGPSDRPGSPGRGRPPTADETPFTERPHRVLPISGRTSQALRDLAGRYLAWLTEDAPLVDAAWTAGVGRSHFRHRAGIVFEDLGSLQAALERVESGAGRESAGGKVAFLYPGEGSERPKMGRNLYESEPVFREVLDRCEAAFVEERGSSLLAMIFGEGEETGEALARPEWSQPALYALGSGLTALWASVGMRPEAVFGHGVGEIAAAGAAGVFDLEDGLRFAARRGALLGSLPEGGATGAAPGGIGEAAGEVSAPSVPLVSGVNGRVLEGVPDGGYWDRQARETVRLGAAVETLAGLGVGVLVEVGTREALGPPALSVWPGREAPEVVAGIRGEGSFASAVGLAYEAGLEVSFAGLFAGERRRRVSLPTYPFQRERYWVEVPKRRRRKSGHPLLGMRRDARDGEVSFETEMVAGAPGWLEDHRVFGEVMAPGALHASLVIEALGETGRGGAVSLEEVQLPRPLVLSGEAGRTVQVVLGSGDRFEVVSREVEERGWEVHAEGRVGTAVDGAEGVDIEALREVLVPAEVEDLYRGLAARGLGYAGVFRSLRGMWTGAGEALGEIGLPEDASGEGLFAHPALLDGCFQVLSGCSELGGGEDGTWLPFGWERLWLSGRLPGRVVCHARLRAGEGETRKADLGFCTAEGKVLGGVEGFTLRRATRAALLGAGVEDLLYEVAWRAGPPVGVRPAAFLTGPEALGRGARPVGEVLSEEGLEEADLAAEDVALEGESRRFVMRALAELGWERRSGDAFEAEELRRRLKVTGEHGRLFGRLLGMLEEAGVVTRNPAGGWLVVLGSEDPLPEGVLVAEGSVERALLRRCGASLSEVLRGRKDPVELLFGEAPGAAEVVRESRAGRAMNRLAGEAVSAAVAGLPEGRRLRVLELGVGPSEIAREFLSGERTDYEVADAGIWFGEAEAWYGERGAPAGRRVLDMERDPEAQGFAGHGYDVVIAANVLHATGDLGVSLGHCRRLLSPSGLLVAVEGTEPRGWLDLTFGLLPGWWRFADGYREVYPLVPREVWRRALSESGYGEVGFVGGVSGQAVLVARSPADLESSPGLFVLTGGGALGRELSRELEGREQRVVSGPEDADREGWRSFFESLPDDVALRGVAHLAGVRGDEAGLTTEELAAAVASVGESGLALVQGMADAGVRPSAGVWLVTRGGRVLEGERGGALSGAPLWGFGATVGLEHGELGLRLLDLDPGAEPAVGALADELLHPDRETRVAHRGGERRVARLARLSGLPEAPEGERVRGDRSYLVTGGLGGIGLSVAGWLADRGAGAVVLNGRRAPEESTAAAVEELRRRGVEVRVELADVTDGAAVDGLLSRMDRELPPLGGVIHSVGVLSDGVVGNLDWGRFEEVLWPKVLGAWRLHRATVDQDLDLFVLFSSAAGVFGNAGQANHAAANAFLDQLARHRRSLGLPGQAIAWGAWSGVGEAEEARERIAGRLAASGKGWITPEQGLAALTRLVAADVGTSVAAAMDWSALTEGAVLLEELVEGDRELEAGAPGDVRIRLAGLSGPEREAELTRFVQEELVSVLRLRSAPAADAGFFDLGMDSLMAVELRNRLHRAFGGEVAVSNTAVFDHPDAVRLARYLAGELGDAGLAERGSAPAVVRREGDRVAIVGMGCRFPGGNGPAEFWGSLVAGRDLVTRGRPDGLFVDAETEAARAYGAYVEGLDRFDAEFFRIPPVEAELLDPQQRLLLEVSWAALEDAGLDPGSLRGSRTGVYAGMMGNDYRELVAPLTRDRSLGLYPGSGVTYSTAVGRVAFALGLEGPAIAVDTACSSSLVAIHQAVAGLERGEMDVALAGGVNAILLSRFTDFMADAGMLASDGRCKTFDAAADGFVRGEGCGMLVLKRLSDAERDGDRVLAVVLGSSVNQDGASAGLTVPNGPAQERVIGEALSRAGVEGSSVDYLEAHGTGTELGDPVEVGAAAAVYGEGRDAERPLLLGSVKTNVGHLEGAAGVAGLIKAVLALREGLIPPHLHFERPNPRIGWEGLPVRVTSEATAWPETERPRRAGVSSFGYSGTNAHLIVERRQSSRWGPSDRHRPPTADETLPVQRTHHVLPLSGKTPQALQDLASRYLAWLTEDTPLADAAWTAGVGRSHFAHRAGLVFGDLETLRGQLESLATGGDRDAAAGGKVAFLYPGEASAVAGNGRGSSYGERAGVPGGPRPL